jgi:hypothetical protein
MIRFEEAVADADSDAKGTAVPDTAPAPEDEDMFA